MKKAEMDRQEPLGNVRWRMLKARRENESRMLAIAKTKREMDDCRSKKYANERREILRRQGEDRAEKMSTYRNSEKEPKRFQQLRLTIKNLRRVGRKEEADEKESNLEKLESEHWYQSASGMAFERECKEEIMHLDLREKQEAKKDFKDYGLALESARREMDSRLKSTKRNNASIQTETWKAAYLTSCGDFEHLRELLTRKPQAAHVRDPDTAWPPLFFAARSGYANCAKLLLETPGGADIDAIDSHGRTALHLAAEFGNLEVASILLDHGANVHCQDTLDKETPLQLAMKRDRTGALTRLLQSFSKEKKQEQKYQKEASSLLVTQEKSCSLAPASSLIDSTLSKLRHIEAARGQDHPSLILTLLTLAAAYRESTATSRAVPPLERALYILRLNKSSPELFATTSTLAPTTKLLEAMLLNNLGELLHGTGRDADATDCFRQAVDITNNEEDSDTFRWRLPPLKNLALQLFSTGKISECIPILEMITSIIEHRHKAVPESGTDPPALIQPLMTLGYAYLLDAQYDKAKERYHRAKIIMETQHGPNSIEVIALINHLALVAYYAEEFDDAENLFNQVYNVLVEDNKRPEDDPDVKRALLNIATTVCRKQNKRTFVRKPPLKLLYDPLPPHDAIHTC